LALCAAPAGAADYPGDGTEGAVKFPPPAPPAGPSLERIQPLPEIPAPPMAATQPLAPINDSTSPPAGVTPAAPPAPPAPLGDLTADRPGTPALRTAGPFEVELDEFPPDDNQNPRAQRAWALVAALKKTLLLMSGDLDAGGRERTRLIYSAEALARDVTVLAGMWPADEDFRSMCVSAKRSAVVLEEKLRDEPRRWSHVRWAFQEAQNQIKTLRRGVALLVADEPRVIGVTKEGAPIYAEVPQDAAAVQREERERRRRELRQEFERLKERALPPEPELEGLGGAKAEHR
jgi:hypothetical protein